MKGKLITNVAEIIKLANEGKSVWYGYGRIPAAFVQNYQARILQNAIDQKLVYHYKKDENVKHR